MTTARAMASTTAARVRRAGRCGAGPRRPARPRARSRRPGRGGPGRSRRDCRSSPADRAAQAAISEIMPLTARGRPGRGLQGEGSAQARPRRGPRIPRQHPGPRPRRPRTARCGPGQQATAGPRAGRGRGLARAGRAVERAGVAGEHRAEPLANHHTPSDQTTEAPSADLTVGRQAMPRPSASWMVAGDGGRRDQMMIDKGRRPGNRTGHDRRDSCRTSCPPASAGTPW